jgi:osmoprotectant transport system ATP-binding protein
LSLEVPAGEICVLVGPSGCGKTTAMRMANRTVEITSGDIRIGERSVKDGDPAKLRREIGYVIQQIGLFPHRTISENIATVPRLNGWDRDRIDQRVKELLELIGLDPEFGDRYPAQLSGGQQQRVGVARALAVDPPVMLMDEPFGAIDPINRSRLQNEFLRLQAEIRKTVLFVTHDVDEAIKMGDRIAVMRKGGELAQFATPTELLMEPADDFVEDFVGADRALKRLALIRISDLSLWTAPLARAGESSAKVLAELISAEVPHAVLVDTDNRPLGWLSEKDLAAETVPSVPDSAAIPTLEGVMTLRDGLATLLASGSQYGVVLDRRGQLDGVLSVEIISEFLASDEAVEAGATAVERAGI